MQKLVPSNAEKKPSRWISFLWSALVAFFAFAMLIVLILVYLESQLPDVRSLNEVQLEVPLQVYSSDGKLIAEYGAEHRIPVSIDQIPPMVIQATLATEDQRYYSHSGVDVLGLARAAVVLVTTGRKEQGGSTITMQVARNYFLSRKKTYSRKLREILLAYKIDHTLSKNKVLELYFNKVFYGTRAYGIAAAAEIYFGKPLNQLTLAEAATLAGLPQAPSSLNPIVNPEAATERRNHVLQRMLDVGDITQQQYEEAVHEPMDSDPHAKKNTVYAPYVGELVRQDMFNKYGQDAYTKGYKVYTTINSDLQSDADSALFNGVVAYDKRHGYRGVAGNLGAEVDLDDWRDQLLDDYPSLNDLQPAAVIAVNSPQGSITVLLQDEKQVTIPWSSMAWTHRNAPSDLVKVGDVIYTHFDGKAWQFDQKPRVSAGIVALSPQTGAVLALVGGFSFEANPYNHITQAYRQPGSSFKPFIYSAALEKGFTLASMINDAPVVMPADNALGLWRPQNDTKKFYGPTSFREALAQSRNLVSIRLLQLITIPYVIDYTKRFGFDSAQNQIPDGLSLALGTLIATPLQMATAYSVFASGGYRVSPFWVDHITDANGKVLFQAQPQVVPANPGQAAGQSEVNFAPQVITAQNAFLMTQAMKDVIQHGTAFAAKSLNRTDLAGKTGTTQNQVDAWFSGYNHTLEATVWVGYDNPASLHEWGADAALPIWMSFMQQALAGKPMSDLPMPPDIVSVRINPQTGALASPGEAGAKFEYFQNGTVPHGAAPMGADATAGNSDDESSSSNDASIY